MLQTLSHLRNSLPSIPRMRLMFWPLLFLLLGGFWVDQAAKIPWVARAIAPHVVEARAGLDWLPTAPSRHGEFALKSGDPGFRELSSLVNQIKPQAQVARLVDPHSLLTTDRGVEVQLVVHWTDGTETGITYNRVRQVLEEEFDWHTGRWKLWLLFAALVLLVIDQRVPRQPQP